MGGDAVVVGGGVALVGVRSGDVMQHGNVLGGRLQAVQTVRVGRIRDEQFGRMMIRMRRVVRVMVVMVVMVVVGVILLVLLLLVVRVAVAVGHVGAQRRRRRRILALPVVGGAAGRRL